MLPLWRCLLDGRAILTVTLPVAEPLLRTIGAYDGRSVIAMHLAELIKPEFNTATSGSYHRRSAIAVEYAGRRVEGILAEWRALVGWRFRHCAAEGREDSRDEGKRAAQAGMTSDAILQ